MSLNAFNFAESSNENSSSDQLNEQTGYVDDICELFTRQSVVIDGNEAIANGEAVREVELCWLAKITDFSFLAKASKKITMEQLEIRSEHSDEKRTGTIRVRRENDTNILTMKAKEAGESHPMEVEMECTDAMKEVFGLLSIIKTIKTRYVFTIDEAHEWEIDVYPDENGEPRTWIKVDLELKAEDKVPNAGFPFPKESVETVVAKTDDMTDAQKELFEEFFQKARVINPDSIYPVAAN